MTIISTFALGAAMFLLAITPGPGVLIVVSKGLSTGFKHTVPVVAGIVAGDLVFLLFAVFGLSLVAETFSSLFAVIKYAGAAFLILLGIKLWHAPPSKVVESESKSSTMKYGFFGGLSITLGNPKVIIFYLGFLPAFLDLTTMNWLDVLIVSVVVSAILGSVMLGYAYAAARAKCYFNNRNAQGRLNKVAGGVMVGTGTLLLTKA